MNILDFPARLRERRLFGFFDDFEWFLSPHLWTSFNTAAGGAGVAVPAGSAEFGGVVQLTTGATQGNEAAIGTSNSPFVPQAGCPLLFEALVSYSEAATNKANLFAGFSDGVNLTGQMQANNAGPKASFNGFGIFKQGGTTVWSCISSKGAVQTISQSQTSSISSGRQSLRIEVQEIDATDAEVAFFVNGQQLLDAYNRPIKHVVNISAFANLMAGVYVQAGAAASEVVSVDYVAGYQQRLAFQ